MSVLIKNMEIPEHCGYCRFRYDGICHALQKTQYSEKECPLVSVNDINAAPTIEPQQWIPVTERLPEIDMSYPHHEDYLVQYDSGDMDVASWSNVNRFWTDHVTEPHWNCVQFAEVIAWMPLPERWKGEADGRR